MSSTLSDPEYRAFVEHLTALRKRLGVTQKELAARLGKPQSYVSKGERFERRIDPAEFRRTVIALGEQPSGHFGLVCTSLDASDAEALLSEDRS